MKWIQAAWFDRMNPYFPQAKGLQPGWTFSFWGIACGGRCSQPGSGTILPPGIEFWLMSELGTPESGAKTGAKPHGGGADSPAFGLGLSTKPEEDGGLPLAVWGTVALTVLIVVGALVLAGRNKAVVAPNTVRPLDAYAASLPLSQLAMSEATSLSGGKMTYLDGHILNSGPKTVTAVTVQVVFQNDVQMPPQLVTLPVMLIRTHEPYIDTETVGDHPLKPADDREFRLTFESVPDNWNTQMPEVRVIQTSLR